MKNEQYSKAQSKRYLTGLGQLYLTSVELIPPQYHFSRSVLQHFDFHLDTTFLMLIFL